MAKPVLGKSVRSDWLFLGRDFAVRTISMETVQAVHFCLGAKPANSKFATKTAKKMWILSFFKAKLPEKAKKDWIFTEISKMDEKDEHSPSEVSVILNIFWCRSWNRHRRKPGDQRRFYQPTEKGKLLNTNKKTATDMNTLLRYIEANGMKMGKLKPYLRPSLTTFCRNLFERTEENRRRIRADDSFQFSAQYKLTALLRRFIRFNISKDNEFEKSWPEKSLQRSESHLFWHEHGKGNKLQAAQAIDEDEALFLNFEFGDPNPVALQRTVWWFLYNTSVSEQENYQSSDLFHRSSFCRCKLNIGSISRCTFQIFHGDVKIVQNERKRRIVIDSDGRLTLKLCLLTMSSFEFNFHSFKLRLSLDPDLIHISIKKVLFDRQKALSRILESTIAFVRFRYKVFLKFCLMNLFFELVVACSFFVWVARVIKSTSRRKASTECHIINNLLTELARAVLPRSRANIPQNGPCVRLVSG